WLDMRYRGQSYELTVPAGDLDAETFTHAFHEAHRATYGHANPREPTEVVLLRLTAVGETGRSRLAGLQVAGSEAVHNLQPANLQPATGASVPQPFATQPVYWQEWHETPLFARGELLPGQVLT